MKVVAYIFVGFVGGSGNPQQNFIWEDLEGKPVLLHIIDKLKMCKKITDVIPYVHLFPERDENKKAFEFAKKWGLELYSTKTDRWEDMLEFQKNIGVGENDIVIFSINSPLIDPELIDSFVEKFKTLGLDYMWTEDFPGGIGVELWKANIWHKFCQIDPKGEFLKSGQHHSFVKTSNIFKRDFIKAGDAYYAPGFNLQVDSARQLLLFRKIYKKFCEEGKAVDIKDVIVLYKKEPGWFEISSEEEVKFWEEGIKELKVSYPQYNDLRTNAFFQLGLVFIACQRYEEAIEHFDKAISLEPRDPNIGASSFFYKGIAHLRQMEYKEAIELFDKAISLEPRDPNTRASIILHKGITYLNQMEYKEAIELFDKAISLEPRDPNIKASIVLHKGLAYFSQMEYKEAIEQFDKAISLEPSSPGIRNSVSRHKGIAFSKLGISVGNQLEIEVANDCNLKCIGCPHQRMKRGTGYMDFELFKKIIDEAYNSYFVGVHFSGLGEPLLHPQAKEMFSYAKVKGLEVGLWTNGLELTEELSKQIIEREFVDYIIFGLDAATKETYAKVKGVDVFDKVTENITRFLKLKKEKVAGMEKDTTGWWGKVKPIIGVQNLKMRETDAEIERFMDKWDFQDKLRKMLNWKQKMEEVTKELRPLEEELNKIKDKLNWREPVKEEIGKAKKPDEVRETEVELEKKRAKLMKPLDKLYWGTFYDKFPPVEHAIIGHFNNYCGQIEDRSVIDVTPLKRFPCKQLQSGISVLWNGDVVLCRQDFDGEHPLGNLKEQGLSEILESENLKDIWQAHKDEEYDKLLLCKDCKEWYYNLYA